ncbi:Diacylglycerol kinase [Lecanora helva]
MSQQYQIPGTPRIISPTPTPTETRADSYFAPITRSAAKRRPSPHPISEDSEPDSSDSSLEKRARTRSRSPKTHAKGQKATTSKQQKSTQNKTQPPTNAPSTNGFLSPSSASSSSPWRPISRSPSPLGLIPIHKHWRSFVHRHEIPRKALHLSIGFFTLRLYTLGTAASSIHPYLLSALIPIASLDFLRHKFTGVNRAYIRALGALMRESEVEGYNGVIWYLLGAWTVLRFMPDDVAVMSILLLSWCDTAASTFGRLYGRYTPRIRKGKSLAGSAAAAIVGVVTAVVFWGWAVPTYGYDDNFLFRGQLRLPDVINQPLQLTSEQSTVGGWVALGIVSLWSGIVASASEVVDVFGWDDNVTIPVLSGLGLWGFFKAFC